jgi:hypothetical protein
VYGLKSEGGVEAVEIFVGQLIVEIKEFNIRKPPPCARIRKIRKLVYRKSA